MRDFAVMSAASFVVNMCPGMFETYDSWMRCAISKFAEVNG